MKIPRYEQQINAPSAPQFSQIADVRSDNLSGVLDTLQGVYEDKLREQEEAKKTAYFQADTSIKMQLDKAMFDIQDRLQNGGSYATAEADYQKVHDAAIKQFGAAFDADETGNVRLRSMAEYQAMGLDNILKIRGAVRQRRKSDATSSANNRLSLLQRQYALSTDPTEREALKSQIAGTVAGLSAAGVIDSEAGKASLRKAIGGAESARLDLVRQNSVTNPQAYLAEVEASKDLLDINDYISNRGTAMKMVADYDSSAQIDNAFAAISSGRPVVEPTQEDVDGHTSNMSNQLGSGIIDTPQFEQSISTAIAVSGKVPALAKAKIEAAFSLMPDKLTPDSAQEAASYSRIVNNAIKQNPTIVGDRQGGIDKDSQLIAQSIVKKTEGGMDEVTAVRETLMRYNDPNFKEIYGKARDEIYKPKEYQALIENIKDDLDVDDVGVALVREDIIDEYAKLRATGMSAKDAKSAAIERQAGRVGKFNGVTAPLSPTSVTTIRNERLWIQSAKRKLAEAYPNNQDYEPVLFGDDETRKVMSRGGDSTEIPFRLGIKLSDDTYAPLNNPKTGQPFYVTADPQLLGASKATFKSTQEAEQISQAIDFGSLNDAIDKKVYAQFLIDKKIPQDRASKFSTINKFVQSSYYKP